MAIWTDWTVIAGFWNWLANNQVQVGLCIAILGALFTLSGLLFAGYQIKTGAKALQASTLYQIQKDGRDLRKDALQDPDYVYTWRSITLEEPTLPTWSLKPKGKLELSCSFTLLFLTNGDLALSMMQHGRSFIRIFVVS